MCDKSSSVITLSKKSSEHWKPLHNYLVMKCQCPSCQEKYSKVKATLKIRNHFRRKLKKRNNNLRILKSISDPDINYLQKKWIIPLYDHIVDINIAMSLLAN